MTYHDLPIGAYFKRIFDISKGPIIDDVIFVKTKNGAVGSNIAIFYHPDHFRCYKVAEINPPADHEED